MIWESLDSSGLYCLLTPISRLIPLFQICYTEYHKEIICTIKPEYSHLFYESGAVHNFD